MAKPTRETKSTKERKVIKMEIKILGLLLGCIIGWLMGVWVSKKI